MKASNINKYTPFKPISLKDREWPNRTLTQAPIWCSVDLRDGNQSLPVPMNINQKVTLFKQLVAIGFKEIEVGFPSASDTEFNFLRTLVEENIIPDDVTIQVLVQAREPLIRRTFESLNGVKNAIVHLYNSTSSLQRKVTFGNASKDEIKALCKSVGDKAFALANDGTQNTLQLQWIEKGAAAECELKYLSGK